MNSKSIIIIIMDLKYNNNFFLFSKEKKKLEFLFNFWKRYASRAIGPIVVMDHNNKTSESVLIINLF